MIEAGVLAKIGSTFALAFIYFWASIPAGMALGLTPPVVAFTAWLSYVAGVVVVVLLGEPLRKRLLARFGGKVASDPNSMIRRVWDRFGLIGLSLLAPVTVGSQTGAIVGLAFGVPPRRLVVGMALGGAAWAILITLAVVLGVTGARAIK